MQSRRLKILVFGATGGTGRHIVEMSIIKGNEVTALVRNPSVLNLSDKTDNKDGKLKVIQGDVLQPKTYWNFTGKTDAVISALGVRSLKNTTVLSQGISNILTAMQDAGIKRIICISAIAIEINPGFSFWQKFTAKILQIIFKHPYADLKRMEEILKNSNSDWTIIRSTRLINKSAKYQYRIAVNQHIIHPSAISRADLADFIVKNIFNQSIYKSVVEISY